MQKLKRLKNLKKFFIPLLAVCLALLTLTAAGSYSRGVYIVIDGVPLQTDGAHINEDGITMVPLRAVALALGLSVSWNPETRTVSIVSGEAEHRPVVMLDPGHGGSSSGAVYEGVLEKDLNLAIAKKTRDILEEAGVLVLMTRTGDQYVELTERTALAAGWCADMIVSIHCNASTDNLKAKGVYTAAYSKDGDSWTLADALRKSIIASTGAANMGTAERPNLVVLRTAAMPAALVECGFMSTPSELAQLVQPEYQDKLAQGIAEGILANLDWEPPAQESEAPASDESEAAPEEAPEA